MDRYTVKQSDMGSIEKDWLVVDGHSVIFTANEYNAKLAAEYLNSLKPPPEEKPKQQPYWVVLMVNFDPPTPNHDTEDSAVKLAKHLAEQFGHEFVVLKAIGSAKANKPIDFTTFDEV